MATRQEMVRRLFELDREAQEGARRHSAVMHDVHYVEGWLETEYGDTDVCERLSWYCTAGKFALEDLFRWVDEQWEDLNKFLEGDERSSNF